MKRRTKILIALAMAGVVTGLITRFVVAPYIVVGESMLPTLREMDLCLMRKSRSYRPQRGDIVVFRTADEPALYFVKRVVGLPGETLAISNGVVLVNDAPLPEEYTVPNLEWDLPATTIASNKVYVLGDNRTVPLDATVHGPVATRLVTARLLTHWSWKR